MAPSLVPNRAPKKSNRTRDRKSLPRSAKSPAPSLRRLSFSPATARRWKDLETLFGERGACGGCWCMAWRKSRSQFQKDKGLANRASLRALLQSRPAPGIIAYCDGQPVGWCAVAPRSVYITLEKSRVLKPFDDQPVWSISCLFIRRDFRRLGLSARLADAAADFAFRNGARIVEAYPVVPYSAAIPAAFAWTGIPAAFTRAGFVEVTRRSTARPIMRRSKIAR